MTPPIDPRRDSGEMQSTPDVAQPAGKPTLNLNEVILQKLEALASDGHETRAALKEVTIGLSRLETSHADHRVSLDRVRDIVADLGQRVTKVEAKAEGASNGANLANRKISDTVNEFTSTMAAVSANQQLVAGKAETVAKKTDEIAKETRVQTTSLSTIEAVNVRQSEQLTTATTLLTAMKANLPAILVGTTVLGTVLGDLLRAAYHAFIGH